MKKYNSNKEQWEQYIDMLNRWMGNGGAYMQAYIHGSCKTLLVEKARCENGKLEFLCSYDKQWYRKSASALQHAKTQETKQID